MLLVHRLIRASGQIRAGTVAEPCAAPKPCRHGTHDSARSVRRVVLAGESRSPLYSAIRSRRQVSKPSLEEARRVRSERLDELKRLPHDELVRYCDHKLACEVVGRDGVKYAHETYTFYDHEPGGLVRVLVEVWAYDPSALDSGWLADKPTFPRIPPKPCNAPRRLRAPLASNRHARAQALIDA
jgi:hypothetical protein